MKRIPAFIARWWREALLVLLFALPSLSLAAFGVAWLRERGALLPWLGGLLAVTLAAVALGRLWRTPRRRFAPRLADREAGAAEHAARARIAELAAAATGGDLENVDRAGALALKVVEAVAEAYHPGAARAAMRFTVPEGLLLAERLSARLRRTLIEEVPALRDVRLSFAFGLHETIEPVQKLWQGYRALRFLMNPLGAAMAEARSLVIDHVGSPMMRAALDHAAAVLVAEIGEAAILLYSGRLAQDAGEIAAAADRDAARALAFESPPGPIDIVIAGQVKAGKSTLINALSGRERAIVSPLPATAGFAAYALDDETAGSLRLVDSQGLTDAPDDDTVAAIAAADLLIWCAAAHRADRALDQLALRRIFAWFDARPARRRPPIILALTQADRLSPAAEWAPPYDAAAGTRPKEAAMRAALADARATLGLAAERGVVIAIPGIAAAWNLRGPGSLWEAIHAALPAAQQKRLERLIGSRGWWSRLVDAGATALGVARQAAKGLRG